MTGEGEGEGEGKEKEKGKGKENGKRKWMNGMQDAFDRIDSTRQLAPIRDLSEQRRERRVCVRLRGKEGADQWV